MTSILLQASWEIEEIDRRFQLAIWGWIAATPDDAWHLLASNGHRWAGRPRRYYLIETRGDRQMRFTANSEIEALTKARAKLAAL